MNKKLLVLGLALSFALNSCETQSVDEAEAFQNSSELSAGKDFSSEAGLKIHEPGFTAEIHEPGFTSEIHEPGFISTIHEPGWFETGSYFGCAETYAGPENLIVNKKDGNVSYSIGDENTMGHLNKINVGNAELTMCGRLHVHQDVNTHNNGVFTFIGLISIGTQEEPADLVINNLSHFEIGGSLHITGNLIINKGGSLDSFKFKDENGQHLDQIVNYLEVEGEIIIEEGYDYEIEGFEIVGEHDHEEDGHQH